MEYWYDKEKNIVNASADNELELEDLLRYHQRIIEDEEISAGFIEYIDLYPTKKCNVHYKDLDHFSPIWEKYEKKNCKCTIVCAPYDITFATFRMIQLNSEGKSQDSAYNFFVFRTKGEVDDLLDKIYKV
jgi:hypothetical protein